MQAILDKDLKKPAPVTYRQVFSNYLLLSDFSHVLIKSKSVDDMEGEIKFREYQRMRRAIDNWGKGVTAIICGSYFYFCLKTKMYVTKVVTGLILASWTNHFFILGSHLGVAMNLSRTLNQLTEVPLNNKTGVMCHFFLNKLNDDPEKFTMNEVYKALYGGSEFIDNEDRTHFKNDYFVKNREKFIDDKGNNKVRRVFNDDVYDKSLPYLDCLLTRYLYYTTQRKLKNILKGFGL